MIGLDDNTAAASVTWVEHTLIIMSESGTIPREFFE